MTGFTDNQRRIWKLLTWTCVCRFYLERDDKGKWCIKNTPWWRIICYYGLWVNTSIKLVYLFLTYRGYLLEIHFLDQMSIWDWWLCASQLVQEVNIWYRKYPLYEVIHANWTIMEDVYKKLGSPEHIQKKIIKNDNQLQILHLMIVFWGCFALMIQFFMNTKYALNTYAIIPYDNFILSCFFAIHEYFYMFHCWIHQTFTVVLVEVYAVSYTHILTEMTNVMNKLIELGEEKRPLPILPEGEEKATGEGEKENGANKVQNSRLQPPQTSAVKRKMSRIPTGTPKARKQQEKQEKRAAKEAKEENHKETPDEVKDRLKIKDKYLDPKTIVPGTDYDVLTLVNDYKRITIAMNQFNAWVGKRMAGTDASSYAQFVSDVFMMIQLLKEPDVDFLGVFFFFEDACAGMVLMFRMLILQSRLMPVAEEFIHSFKCYMQYDTPYRKFFLKTLPSLRIVASKVGGYSVRPITVPKGVNALMNFYISAAMWQRPKDRLT